MLQVPLGCVTPFAVVNDSARDVVLLLDQGFKTHEFCFFHPLANDMTISLNAHDLDEFLKSIGKDPSYVDFEAIPVVSKDQPPDLAALVPSSSILVSHQSEMQPSSQVPADGNHASVENKSQIVSEQVFKPSISKKVTKEKPVNNGHSSNSFADVGPLVEEILHKASDLLLSEIKEDTIKQHGEHLGTVVSDNLREVLVSDLKNLAMIFKNSAYTEGFHAGCSVAICDKIKQSAEGAIQAVVEFVTTRGNELTEIDISRTTQSKISSQHQPGAIEIHCSNTIELAGSYKKFTAVTHNSQ
ncbi:hypothetical protein KIW84_UN0200 [Lathyrus oleraceus]|nr:hypothetical protein KIW84_UN0200 [Pisum sativum]